MPCGSTRSAAASASSGPCSRPSGGRLRAGALAHALGRYPLMTVQVMARIRWQALRLWRKRVPFHRKPPFDPERGSVAP